MKQLINNFFITLFFCYSFSSLRKQIDNNKIFQKNQSFIFSNKKEIVFSQNISTTGSILKEVSALDRISFISFKNESKNSTFRIKSYNYTILNKALLKTKISTTKENPHELRIEYFCQGIGSTIIDITVLFEKENVTNYSIKKKCGVQNYGLNMGYSSKYIRNEIIASKEICDNGKIIRQKFENYFLNETTSIVEIYMSYKTSEANPKSINFKSIYLEIEDPSLYSADITLNSEIANKYNNNSMKTLSFLQLEDDFIDNTNSDGAPVFKNKHSEENYFLENSSPEYLNSVLNLENGTVIQNGLITKLNEILLNLMLSENQHLDNDERKSNFINYTLKQEEKIKYLEKILGSLNTILMNLSNENNKLKSDVDDLIIKFNLINSTQLNNSSNNTNLNSLSSNISNVFHNETNYGNMSNLTNMIENEINKNFTKGIQFLIQNSSFNISANISEKILINFKCLKDGISKIRLYFNVFNEYNPFSPFFIEWLKYCHNILLPPSKIVNISTENKSSLIINTTNLRYIDPETANLIIYMVLNDSNISKQMLGVPMISVSDPTLALANITNKEDLKNVSIIYGKSIPIMVNMKCLDYGNTTLDLVIPLEPSNTYKNLNYSYIKGCFSPNFGLNIYSKRPNSSLENGDIVTNDALNNSFYLTIEKNVSKFFIYLIAKNISKNTYYILTNHIISDKNSIGKSSSPFNTLKLDKKNNKNYFEIDFECHRTGNYLTHANIEVKGYKNYDFVLNKRCEVEEFSWINILIKSKYLVWMFLGSILALLLILLFMDNFACVSEQDTVFPLEPNEAALSLLYDIKYYKREKK